MAVVCLILGPMLAFLFKTFFIILVSMVFFSEWCGIFFVIAEILV